LGQKFVNHKPNLLKAAGTPIINAFPLAISLKLTLLPGESSTRTSSAGILSPTLMKARAELWKDRAGRAAMANRRMADVDAMIADGKINLCDQLSD
jgi:hypothetical protein